MRLVNLTPHDINVVREDGTILDIPPSGTVARAQEIRRAVEITGLGVPVTEVSYGQTEMPPTEKGVIFVVSALAAQGISGRSDFLIPGTPKRNEAGQVIGCSGLSRYVRDEKHINGKLTGD